MNCMRLASGVMRFHLFLAEQNSLLLLDISYHIILMCCYNCKHSCFVAQKSFLLLSIGRLAHLQKKAYLIG